MDNYQGEENDVVILSLVRSNDDEQIGFLRTSNRACVALSRARHAFYCIGNMQLLESNSAHWAQIVRHLRKEKCLGDGITLTCGKHDANDLTVRKPADFALRPDGGCMHPCAFRLRCGHACTLRCHPYDEEHARYVCMKECGKQMAACGHLCSQRCGHKPQSASIITTTTHKTRRMTTVTSTTTTSSDEDACNQCSVLVTKKLDDCGHVVRMRCDAARSGVFVCRERCEKVFLLVRIHFAFSTVLFEHRPCIFQRCSPLVPINAHNSVARHALLARHA